MNSKKNTDYWLEKIREETVSNTHIEGAQYVQDVVRSEIDQISTIDTRQNQEKDTQTDKTDEEATEYHEDEQNEVNETKEDESA